MTIGGFPWRPLGDLPVDRGLISELKLEQALAEQRESSDRLGRILVRRGAISVGALTHAPAEQYGVELEPTRSPRTAMLSGDTDRPHSTQVSYEVLEADDGEWVSLQTGGSFLDATDLAFDVLYERDPAALQIVLVESDTREAVWAYRRRAA